jgi:hypothetical protein
MLAFKYFSAKPTLDCGPVLGYLLQSQCVRTQDTGIVIDDEYRPRKGVQEIRQGLAPQAQESWKAGGTNAMADGHWVARRSFHAAQIATTVHADLLHLVQISPLSLAQPYLYRLYKAHYSTSTGKRTSLPSLFKTCVSIMVVLCLYSLKVFG